MDSGSPDYFIGVAQQQDGGRGTRVYGFGH
mgnify:CR=1 FL=1